MVNRAVKEVIGSWIQATGTVIAAIGVTPSKLISKEMGYDLDLWGNVLQASGNALQANGELSLNKIANEIQAIGNISVVTGFLANDESKLKDVLIIKGDLLQALGGGIISVVDFERRESEEQIIIILGNVLQTIGNSIQAIGAKYELKDGKEMKQKGKTFILVGSWIQATGSVIAAIGLF
ncbi:DUF6944 family repetitive protein [Virgibacillus sp. MG-45]|uniref:DUF6944 family repetitive protein n=1 Tax=Virgibacillus sp. MG-45 TaxID=3102791 RepID=UPI002ED79BB3